MNCHSERSEAESKKLSMPSSALLSKSARVTVRSLAALGMTLQTYGTKS